MQRPRPSNAVPLASSLVRAFLPSGASDPERPRDPGPLSSLLYAPDRVRTGWAGLGQNKRRLWMGVAAPSHSCRGRQPSKRAGPCWAPCGRAGPRGHTGTRHPPGGLPGTHHCRQLRRRRHIPSETTPLQLGARGERCGACSACPAGLVPSDRAPGDRYADCELGSVPRLSRGSAAAAAVVVVVLRVSPHESPPRTPARSRSPGLCGTVCHSPTPGEGGAGGCGKL
jgi:hypothetical protein